MTLPNGRDLGGHPVAGGRVVRPGLVLRSAAPRDDLHREWLAAAGVTTALDLRTAPERAHQPPAVPATTAVVSADLLADEPEAGPAALGSIARAAVSGDTGALSGERLDQIFVAGYRSFVSLDSGRTATARVLQHLADRTAGPTVIHCTAGKDRTGWVVAVVLSTLGVPWDDVMRDYLRSGPEVLRLFAPFRDRIEAEGGDVAGMERAIAVYPHYLEAARAEMERRYGDWDGYVSEGLALSPAQVDALRARLTR